MRRTKTWTISLPPELSALAERIAQAEHRTKSELVREALRRYVPQPGAPPAQGTAGRLARVGELVEAFRQRHGVKRLSEAELRREFRGIRQLHDRLQHLTG